jgi:phosphoenolpyruvate carboxylase
MTELELLKYIYQPSIVLWLVPPNEPYRVILGDVRDKLYNTRERARQLLANGISDIPEDVAFTNVEQVFPSLQFW